MQSTLTELIISFNELDYFGYFLFVKIWFF